MRIKPKTSSALYQEYGSGDNIIILIHGFLSSSKYWNKIVPSLVKAKYRVISINLLGFGNAEKPTNIEYGYGDQIEYIKKIIDGLNCSKPINLVGHSMGAAIATRYAMKNVERVQSLILIHPPLYKDSQETRNTLMRTGRLYRYLISSKYRNAGWHLLRLLLPRAIASHTHYSRESSLKNIILKAEVIADLETISVKTLLIIGLKDRAIYQDNLPSIMLNPNIEVLKENVGHHSPVKNPVLVRKYILNHINISSKLVH